MTYENKGAVGSTVTVSMDPNRSGNYPCDGVNDNIEIQAALDEITEGTVLVYGDPTGSTDFSLGATVDIAYRKTLKFVWGHTVVPASDIRMFEVAAGGSLQGLQADVSGLGDEGFTNEVVYLDGTRNGDDTWWRRGTRSRFRDITIHSGWRVDGAWTPSGVGIELEATGSDDNVSWTLWDDIAVMGQFEKSINLTTQLQTPPTIAWVNANHFNNVFLQGGEYMIYLDAPYQAEPEQWGMVNANIFNNLTMQYQLSCVTAIFSEYGSGNQFRGFLWDWPAVKIAYDLEGDRNLLIIGSGRDIIGNVQYVDNQFNVIIDLWNGTKVDTRGYW